MGASGLKASSGDNNRRLSRTAASLIPQWKQKIIVQKNTNIKKSESQSESLELKFEYEKNLEILIQLILLTFNLCKLKIVDKTMPKGFLSTSIK